MNGAAMTLDLSNPESWPVRMVLDEVAQALRISRRSLYDRIATGRFPKSDDGRSWDRDVVVRYVKGGVRQFERKAEEQQRRGSMRMVAR